MIPPNSRFRLLLIFLIIACIPRKSSAFQQHPDSSAESAIVEQIATDVTFSADGTGERQRSARIRIESDAGVQQFGVLTFPYSSAFERLEILQIQVKKPDGSIVLTPDSDAQDLPTQATRAAPTYSDAREKQIPVKGLSVGDVLEWRVRIVRTVADVPGQFWYVQDFVTNSVVLEETLRVTVPPGKYVKVSSPGLSPDVREENNRIAYSWKTHHELAKEDTRKIKIPSRIQPHPAVQITTFKTWEEVGRWYSALEKPRGQVTPEIQAKASELTRGLSTPAEKERAIYQFVSTKFRYIELAFGQGRFQPHSASEVLANQYGDCKDKHTLFSALLSAVGIEAWPVLIGAGIEFDPEVPSPAQFNHLITYIPGSQSALWLDTTPEVAPFGVLETVLQDQKALVIPESGAPILMTTPDSLPFPTAAAVEVKSKLDAIGTLTGSLTLTLRGDGEITLRSAFHATAPAQWTQLLQNLSAGMGLGGTVSNVSVDNPTSTESPFHFSYNYERKTYSDWDNRRFTAPLPPLGNDNVDQLDLPTEPAPFGALGKITYRAAVELPSGYSIRIPSDASLQTNFASYKASYSVDQGVLLVERTLVRKKSKIEVSEWDEYRKFAKAISVEERQYLQLVRADGAITVIRDNQDASELVREADEFLKRREFNAAADALTQAERLNPRQFGLWAEYGYMYELRSDRVKAIEAMQKELVYHPENERGYVLLALTQRQAGRLDDEIETRKRWVKIAPGSLDAVTGLVAVLFGSKKYGEAIEPLETALKSNPGSLKLETSLLNAHLRGGDKAGGLEVLVKLREQKLDAGTENDVAYALADTNTELGIAQELALKAVAELEEQSGQVMLSTLTSDDLRRVISLGHTWDTLGWTYFRTSDLPKAEMYLLGAWILLQDAVVADHLGQVYEKEGKTQQAIHSYQLALAARSNMPETRARLAKLGPPEPVPRAAPASVSPTTELMDMRSLKSTGIAEPSGSAEVFLLFSKKGIVETRFISGDEKLRGAITTLSTRATSLVLFPDNGPEKIARRGIVSCSQYTKANCTFVLLLPANTKP